jgi:hypothetical protein
MTDPSFWSRFARATTRERIDALNALWRVIVVRALLATIGVRRTQSLLVKPAPRRSVDPLDVALWSRRVVAIRRAAARVPGAVCLARSLTLCWWMSGAGLRPELKMGVRLGLRGAEGHAWTVLNGRALDESDEVIATYQLIPW